MIQGNIGEEIPTGATVATHPSCLIGNSSPKLFLKYYFVVCVCACAHPSMHEFMCIPCVQEPTEAKRGWWILCTGWL